MTIDREHLYKRGDGVQDSQWNDVFYMTRLDWVKDLTQSVLNGCIKFDAWKKIENCTVLKNNTVFK